MKSNPGEVYMKFDRVFRRAAMKYALFTYLKFTLQPFFDHIFDTLPQLRDRNPSHHLIGEGKHQQHACTLFPDTPLPEVEHRFGIKLPG